MIRRTFQLITGVGPYREKDLWARGFEDWKHFLERTNEVIVSKKADPELRARLEEAEAAWAQKDLRALAILIPPREHWRLYPEFANEAVFLDIEAEGQDSPVPTVVGLFDADGPKTYVRGRNLEEVVGALAQRPLWVSFNGSAFDLPILRRHFQDQGVELPDPLVHIDLRHLARKLGWRGGLKQIEDSLGIARPPHLRGVNGWDAVVLWRAYQHTGDIEALRFLVEYNLYDAFQLRSVLEHGWNRLVDRLACDVPRLTPFDRGDVLYDVTRLLLAISPSTGDLDRLQRLREEYAANGA